MPEIDDVFLERDRSVLAALREHPDGLTLRELGQPVPDIIIPRLGRTLERLVRSGKVEIVYRVKR
jgi:hypothetical protein